MIANYMGETVRKVAGSLGVDYTGTAVRVDYPPEYSMGHYATPVAMELARAFRKSPKEIAGLLKESIEKDAKNPFEKVSVEGPGFINLFLKNSILSSLFQKEFSFDNWLSSLFRASREAPVIFEYVSANPTGPLNIVSARAAAVGDSISRVMKRAGLSVFREYYVNDYGNQVRLLGISFAWRYLEKNSIAAEFPEEGYRGEYIKDILEIILSVEPLPAELALPSPGDAGEWLERAGQWFGPRGVQRILETQKKDLSDFGAEFDSFFLESSLHDDGRVQAVLEILKDRGAVYEQEGAWFFRSTDYGDDKDRVVVRGDGRPTYLLADIAYHYSKMQRGYKKVFDIWGPDHHGYIARLSGALTALGFGAQALEEFKVLIVQQVNLLEGGKPVVMSKRLGQFQTMRDLLEKIPPEVSRFFFVTRAQSTHLDFDLELALNQSSQNPVYYIQYAHARIHSIFREAGFSFDADFSSADLPAHLTGSHRDELLFFALRFPEEIFEIAHNREVQRLPVYLTDLATLFTKFYHAKENRIKDLLSSDPVLAHALLALIRFVSFTLREGLSLLGISAPEKM